MKEDHERIWLQNAEDAKHCNEGRLWCQDKVWPVDKEDSEPTEYVRADLFASARKAALEEAAKEVDKLQTMALGMVRRHKLYGRDAETLKAAAHVVRALIEKEG